MRIHSISTAVLLGILLALTSSFLGAGWYTISVSKKELYADFERQRNTLAATIAAAMADPIATFSPNNGSRVLEIVKQSPELVTVEVYDSMNDMGFINIDVPERRLGNLFEARKKIAKDGEEIGWVRLVFSDQGLAKTIDEKTSLFKKVFGLTFLANIVIMFPLLYIKLFAPLKRLSRQAYAFWKNDLEQSFVWHGRDELSRVGQSFERARVSTLDLVNKLKDSNDELTRLSVTDRLTGLFNRRKLDELLAEETARCARYGGNFGVVLLDIDHFKLVNDTYGHQVGDDVLTTFAKVLSSHTRESDVVGRWGGEEFLIVCRETDRDGVAALAEKLRATVQETPFPVVGNKTASFGVAVFDGEESMKDLVSRADGALYAAKEGGRNRVEIH